MGCLVLADCNVRKVLIFYHFALAILHVELCASPLILYLGVWLLSYDEQGQRGQLLIKDLQQHWRLLQFLAFVNFLYLMLGIKSTHALVQVL